MDELKKEAVQELDSLIRRIEAGEYNNSECSYDVHVDETNISTEKGTVTHVLLQYNIKHIVIE